MFSMQAIDPLAKRSSGILINLSIIFAHLAPMCQVQLCVIFQFLRRSWTYHQVRGPFTTHQLFYLTSVCLEYFKMLIKNMTTQTNILPCKMCHLCPLN